MNSQDVLHLHSSRVKACERLLFEELMGPVMAVLTERHRDRWGIGLMSTAARSFFNSMSSGPLFVLGFSITDLESSEHIRVDFMLGKKKELGCIQDGKLGFNIRRVGRVWSPQLAEPVAAGLCVIAEMDEFGEIKDWAPGPNVPAEMSILLRDMMHELSVMFLNKSVASAHLERMTLAEERN